MALIKKGNNYYVRYTVPTEHRKLLGRSQIWQTTKTADKAEAKKRSHKIMHDIIESVEARVAGEPQVDARAEAQTTASDLLLQVADGSMDHDTASLLMTTMLEGLAEASPETPTQHLKDAYKTFSSGGTHKMLPDAIEEFHQMRKGKVAEDTRERQYNVLMAFCEQMGPVAVNTITRRIAGQYIADVIIPSVDKRTGKPKTYKSKCWDVGSLRAAWKYFISRDWTGEQNGLNPWNDHLENYRPSRKELKAETLERRIWSPEEIEQVRLTADFNDPMHQAWMLCLHMGCRIEEILSLKAGNLDLKAKTFEIVDAKNEASEDIMPMHKDTIAVFTRLADGLSPEDHLFNVKPDCKGRYSGNLVKRGGRWLREHISSDRELTFYHSLRHTLPTRLEEAGIDPHMIKRVERHSFQDDTFGRYSKGPGLDRLREALDSVDFGF